MGLSARELLIILRLQDEASAAIRSFSGNLATASGSSASLSQTLVSTGLAVSAIGDVMARAGKAGVGFFNDATDMAMEWDKQSRLTLTQAKDVGLSLEDIEKIGQRVGKNVPVAMDQIQPTLFDIFSTVKTDGAGAEQMLYQFAKAAVAGGADIQDVARTTLAEMNAFGLGVGDTSHLLDTQFQMVKFGVGTYDEFASSMGLSIPTARAAGQNIDTLSGSLAFMTRNGLSVASSTASVGRAFELLYGKKGQEGLKKLGIDIYDSNGHLKQMNQIVTELAVNKGWAALDPAQRKLAFADAFGQGTIQARRFFDVAIPNYASLNEITGEMTNSTGAMGDAFAIMMDAPANKALLFKNNLDFLRKEIGDQLIPAKERLYAIGLKLIDMWENLSPHVRNLIVQIAAGVSVFLLVGGTILGVVGSIMVFIGVLGSLSIEFGTMLLITGGILVAVLALAAGAYLLYRNWDTVKNALVSAWHEMKSAWDAFMSGFQGGSSKGGILGYIQDLGRYIADAWHFVEDQFNTIRKGLVGFWNTLTAKDGEGVTDNGFSAFMERIAVILRDVVWPAIQVVWGALQSLGAWLAGPGLDGAKTTFQAIADGAQWFWDKVTALYNWFVTEFGPGFMRIWDSIRDNAGPVLQELIQTAQHLIDVFTPVAVFMGTYLVNAFKSAWAETQTFLNVVRAVFDFLAPYIATVMGFIWDTIKNILQLLLDLWTNVFNFMKVEIVDVWNFISRMIADAITIISNVIQLFLNILQGDWSGAWQNIKNILSAVWDQINAVIRFGWETIKNLFWLGINSIVAVILAFVSQLYDTGRAWINALWQACKDIWPALLGFFQNIPGAVKGTLSGMGSLLYDVGKALIQGMINGVFAMKDALYNAAKSVATTAKNAITGILGIHSPSTVFHEYGKMTVLGFQQGLESQLSTGRIQDLMATLNPEFSAPNVTNVSSGPEFDLEKMTDRIVAAIGMIKPVHIDTVNNGVDTNTEKTTSLDFWGKVENAGVS